MRKIIIICFLGVLFGNYTYPQSLKFKPLTTKDGLSNNSVNDITSDSSCRLWIATWDGLNIYDGHQVKTFKHQIGDRSSIAGNMVYKFLKDPSGCIWMLTDNNAVSKYLGNGKFQNFHFKSRPEDLMLSKAGYPTLLFDNTYLSLEGKKLRKVAAKDVILKNDEDLLRNMLLSRYPNVIINDILQDSEGDIWYATKNDGLFIISGSIEESSSRQVQHYTYDLYSPHTFTSDEIEILYEDDFKNIWMGHKDGGLSMAYKGSRQISTITPHPIKYPHLPNETIRAVTKDHDDNLWLGYYSKGIYSFNKTTNCFVKVRIKEATVNADWNRARTLFTSDDGTVWAGTYAGIIKFRNNNYTLYEADKLPLFPNGRNYSIAQDGRFLWVSCWGGLAKYSLDKAAFVNYRKAEKLRFFHIRHVLVDGKDLLLATEKHGMVTFNTETGAVTEFGLGDGILGSSVYHISKDPKTGFYWIASLGGISVYQPGKGVVKNLTESDGLPSHLVYSLIKHKDTYWASTTKGISAIDVTNYAVSTPPKEQGWQGEEFSEGSFFQDKRGVLFYGGINGLSYFQPGSYTFDYQKPKIRLVVDGNENYRSHIQKTYDDNDIEIHLTPVIYQTSLQKVFYKLEGYNKAWMPYVSELIKYENIPPGDYQLLIKTGLNSTEIQTALQLTVKRAFYQSWWFYIFLLLVSGFSFYIYSAKKTKSAKRRAIALENKIAERTAEINNQKKKAEQINAALEEKSGELLKIHQKLKNKDFEIEKFKAFVLSEFKLPLSKIVSYAHEIDGPVSIKSELGKEAVQLIETIKQWDYLDDVKELGPLNLSQVRFSRFAENLIHQAEKEGQNKIISSYEIRIKEPEGDILLDVLRFKLMFQYLLNDFSKYLEDESYFRLSIISEEHQLVLLITSDSTLLKSEWSNIEDYEPYHQAFRRLLKDLGGAIRDEEGALFAKCISIPVSRIDTSGNEKTNIVYLKGIEHKDHLDDANKNILVLCREDDIEIVRQMLSDESYQLIFENDPNMIVPALNQYLFDALVLYNTTFTEPVAQLLEKIRNTGISKICISEKISVFMQERASELDVDSMLFMPLNPGFVMKEINRLLSYPKRRRHEETLEDFFSIGEEGDLTPHEKLVKDCMEIIKRELPNADFNVDKLIGHLNISRTKCYRAFKEVMDKSPSDVIIGLRLQKASYLLKNKRLNISEVCYDCGFNDPRYFSRLFKKYYMVNPKAYKEKKPMSES